MFCDTHLTPGFQIAHLVHAAGSATPLTRTSAYSTAGLSIAAPSCPWPREQDKVFTASNFEAYGRKKGPFGSAVGWLQGMLAEVCPSWH